MYSVPNTDDHVTNALLELGIERGTGFVVEHDRCVVSDRAAIRRLVERRELVEAAGLHVSMVANSEGIASLALVSVAEPGFFHVMINSKGRPVGEAPMRFDADVGKRIVRRAPGQAGSEDGPVAGRAPHKRDGSSRERERANASEGIRVWTHQNVVSIVYVYLNAEIERSNKPEPLDLEVLRIIGPLANSGDRDSTWLVFQNLAVADRLATVAREIAQFEPIRYNKRGLRRLGKEIVALLQESGYTRLESNADDETVGVSTAPEGADLREGQMATREKKGAKKGSAKKGSAKKGSAKSNSKTQESSRRKITEEIAQKAIDMRADDATWAEVQEETGFTGAQLRPHMAKLQGVDVNVPKTPKGIAAARKKGLAWYTIAEATGLSVAECKEKAAEGGADVEGRVYTQSENGSKSDKKGSSKKGAKKGGKKSKKEDPSEEE